MMKRSVIAGLACSAVLALVPAVSAQASAPQAGPGPGGGASNNTLLNIPIGLCGADVPVLAIPVSLLPGGDGTSGGCISGGR